MRRRDNPLRWPVAGGLAVGLLLAVCLFTPRSWLAYFLAPPDQTRLTNTAAKRPWLELLPPPGIEVVRPRTRPTLPEDLPPPVPPVAADWWRSGWRVRVATRSARELRTTVMDSVSLLLDALGVGRDLPTRSRPDSLLAVRLLLMRCEDAFGFEELKPYLRAMTRAAVYRDIQSRSADMYDEFLQQEIITPD